MNVEELKRIKVMLRGSFGAIKQDMLSLKHNQELQINGTHSLKEELGQMKDTFVHKIELKKELIDFDRNHVQHLEKEVEALRSINQQLVQTLNTRIRELNKQFSDIDHMRKELAGKVKLVNSFENSLRLLNKDMNDNMKTLTKEMVSESQVAKLIEDFNDELDHIKANTVSQKEFDKKIAKIEKKL